MKKCLLFILMFICINAYTQKSDFINQKRFVTTLLLMDSLKIDQLQFKEEKLGQNALVEYYQVVNNINVIFVYINDICVEQYFIYLERIEDSNSYLVTKTTHSNIYSDTLYTITYCRNCWYKENRNQSTILTDLRNIVENSKDIVYIKQLSNNSIKLEAKRHNSFWKFKRKYKLVMSPKK